MLLGATMLKIYTSINGAKYTLNYVHLTGTDYNNLPTKSLICKLSDVEAFSILTLQA